ncbi:MAG: AMP-binding protein, partial [Exilibacterium sp.]
MRHEAESLHGLLARLAELNIKIGLDGEQLRVDAPTGVLDEDVKQALRHHKNNLVIDLKKARGGQAPSQWPQVQVDPDSRYEPFPLTDIQWAYWLGRNNGIELGNVATHFYFEVDSQELDIDRFQQAFRLLIARHDMLRGIVDNDGQQRILSVVPEYHITVEDLSTASAELQDTHLSRIRTQMSHQVRETDQWPLFDVRAARLGQKTRLFFSWDFLNLDAWSLFLMFREWRVLYDNIDQSLPTISISYRDYVLTERLLKKSDGYGLAHDYWWARIDHMPGAPILPVKAKIASDRQHRFVRRRGRITRALWQSLRRRGQARGLTPSGILLAAFAEVLTLWSKRPHFCLNLTLFNRLPLHKDVECLIGDFTSILLLEVNNQQVEAFYERAARIQKQFMKDLQHREISGVEVLREWSKRQGNALQAVMPVVFTSALALGSGEESDAGVLESFGPMVYGISQTPQVYLDVQVMEDSQGVFFNWDAVEEVFEPGVLDAMFTSYCQLLEQLTDSKLLWEQRHVLTLPAGQARQRQAVNATAVDLSDELLHGLFIQQALQQPKSVAIVSAEHQITYGELLAMSHSLSQQLLDRGVSPNTLVAVVMEKGWEQIVAVLGILIAGAAYLPIDPALPTTRRQQYFEQSQARLAITQQALQPVLEWPGHIDCLVVSRDLSLNWLEQAPRPRQTITDLAYVIFTSGSTGVPKGVMINHRGAVNTILHVNRLFEINAQDKVLAVSSLSFDLSVYDIFGLLATGGTIVMPEPQRVHHPEHWQALINKYGITVWNSAPPLMGMLTDHLEGEKYENIRSLRLALLSGDWVPVSLPDRVKQHCPNTRVISLGGATEASIWSIYYPIGEVAPHWQSIPYGKPLPNQRVYVLNSALQHCPQGVIGHIYIGGVGLAQGYWNDRERTAK